MAGICTLVENAELHVIRLYEQEPGESFDSARLGLYVQRWVRCTWAGIGDLNVGNAPSIVNLAH